MVKMKLADYEKVKSKLLKLSGNFDGLELQKPLKIKEFEKELDIDTSELEMKKSLNDYGTLDVALRIETNAGKTILLYFEMNEDNEITHLLGMTEF